MASIIIGKTRPASKLNRSPIEQPFGDALWPRTTSLVGLPLLAGDLLAARAWPPVRGGSGVSMAATAKRVASTIIGNTRRGSNQDTIGAPLSRDVAFWCVCIENAIDSALQLWRPLPPHDGGHAKATRDQRDIALIPINAATNERRRS